MRKRIWSASALVCALLLLLSSASLAKSSHPTQGNDTGSPTRVGQGVDHPVLYGDDDSPDDQGKDDESDDSTGGKGTIASSGDASWRLKDLWASFRLQLWTVLRVWK